MGHNALGAWWWLATSGRLTLDAPTRTFTQEIDGRVLPVEVRSERGRVIAVSMAQADPVFGAVVGEGLAAGVGARPGRRRAGRGPAPGAGGLHRRTPSAGAGARPRCAGPGSAQVGDARGVPPLGRRAGLLPLLPRPARSRRARRRRASSAPTSGSRRIRPPEAPRGRSPRTWWRTSWRSERRPVIVEQGRTMGRPSRIEVRVSGGGVRVSGSAVLVVEGRLRL